jgi:hypothetical protein
MDIEYLNKTNLICHLNQVCCQHQANWHQIWLCKKLSLINNNLVINPKLIAILLIYRHMLCSKIKSTIMGLFLLRVIWKLLLWLCSKLMCRSMLMSGGSLLEEISPIKTLILLAQVVCKQLNLIGKLSRPTISNTCSCLTQTIITPIITLLAPFHLRLRITKTITLQCRHTNLEMDTKLYKTSLYNWINQIL